MVVFIDEILHIPLPYVLIPCNHKFGRASNTSNIPWLPLLNLPLQLLFVETFTTANKLPKGPLIVAVAPLTIAFPNTKSFPLSVFVIKQISLCFTTKYLPNNFIVLQQRIKTQHFLLYQSATFEKSLKE